MQKVGAQHPHLAGQRVDRDFGAGGAVGEVEERTPFRSEPIPMDLRRLVIAGVRRLHARQTAGLRKLAEAHGDIAREDPPVAELDRLGRDVPRMGRKSGHSRLDRAGSDFRRHAVEVGSRRGGGRRGVGNLGRIGRGDAHEMQWNAKLFRNDLRDLGEQPLPHLRAAVIEMDRAVGIDVDKRGGLVERDERERDAEHHRGQRDASLDDRARRVEGGDPFAAGAIVARNLELLDDRPLGLVVLDRLIVGRAIEARAQQVGLAHVERIEAALARDRVHHPLDGDHALRAAEAAKGGVGDGVGLEAARDDRDVGQPVAVAGVEHRAVARLLATCPRSSRSAR